MLPCFFLILMVSPVYGLNNIESKPAKVANGDFVKLVCNVGRMNNTVEWSYGGIIYFSCNSPYTNCFTNTRIKNDGYFDFSIKGDSLIVILPVVQNQTDGIWSCYHGSEKADFEIDNADAAVITRLYPTTITSPPMQVLCTVQSHEPVDVLIYTIGYQGKRTLYDVKQSNLSQHIILSTTFLCSDSRIYCNVTNGYGPTASLYGNVYLQCPLKILQNFPYTTTLKFNDRTSSGEIKIYYEGYPTPSSSIYRIGADDIPEVNKYYSGIQASVRYQTKTEPGFVNVYISDYDTVETGRYILTLKQDNITEVIYLNLIYLTTTSALPTSTIGTTTNRPKDINITPEETTHDKDQKTSGGNAENKAWVETKIMLYVTGFVISMLLKF